MGLRFLGTPLRLPSIRDLSEARSSLSLSILSPRRDRRGEERVPLLSLEDVSNLRKGALLNLSQSGLAIGVTNKCLFARGERYRFVLREGSTAVDLEGKVCWTQSTWNGEPARVSDADYLQTAGFLISRSLSRQERKSWEALRETARDQTKSLDLAAYRVARKGH